MCRNEKNIGTKCATLCIIQKYENGGKLAKMHNTTQPPALSTLGANKNGNENGCLQQTQPENKWKTSGREKQDSTDALPCQNCSVINCEHVVGSNFPEARAQVWMASDASHPTALKTHTSRLHVMFWVPALVTSPLAAHPSVPSCPEGPECPEVSGVFAGSPPLPPLCEEGLAFKLSPSPRTPLFLQTLPRLGFKYRLVEAWDDCIWHRQSIRQLLELEQELSAGGTPQPGVFLRTRGSFRRPDGKGCQLKTSPQGVGGPGKLAAGLGRYLKKKIPQKPYTAGLESSTYS